ncbi:DUF2254 domain-containing protein [Citreimonas salinaria]|uniref:Uncharacterized membrane protein n=1 Tax=Citreimonas salinaria TaxID=321339 RepID=A0A1H3H791_9RHOB|nr:DUF2254 domain-containing protein [Citreimonas salinaria]SDY10778.1 Uncharacterized membrane protein [Citreimonas salinaria]
MHDILFRALVGFRQNYWFWPTTMTLAAVILGFLLPWLDDRIGTDWIRSVPFLRATQVDGARAILTTLAGATLGVAGVAFSVTIVAVSFASSNYGPRLIGNFMGDKTNQVVLGVFVATFVYCMTVLSTVHARLELAQSTQEAFVPQISVLFAFALTLAAVGALIGYIHHIPESINIMNVTAHLGDKLRRSVASMLDDEDRRQREEEGPADVEPWTAAPPGRDATILRAETAGFLQQVDLDRLASLARERGVQITIHHAPGAFVVQGEIVLSAQPPRDGDDALLRRLRDCATLGSNRTDVQDLLFLSDQLVEVLGRALSPGINDPNTAMLCLNWLAAGLTAFARREPARPARRDDPVLYRRVTFEEMLDRSFDQMRQYVASDRTVTLHALDVLRGLAASACRPAMAEACIRQMRRLAASAAERLDETVAKDEIAEALAAALRDAADRAR